MLTAIWGLIVFVFWVWVALMIIGFVGGLLGFGGE